MSLNNISTDDENFLKEFLKGFYRQITKIVHYPKFENILINWMEDYFNHNEKNPEIILKQIQIIIIEEKLRKKFVNLQMC